MLKTHTHNSLQYTLLQRCKYMAKLMKRGLHDSSPLLHVAPLVPILDTLFLNQENSVKFRSITHIIIPYLIFEAYSFIGISWLCKPRYADKAVRFSYHFTHNQTLAYNINFRTENKPCIIIRNPTERYRSFCPDNFTRSLLALLRKEEIVWLNSFNTYLPSNLLCVSNIVKSKYEKYKCFTVSKFKITMKIFRPFAKVEDSFKWFLPRLS